MRHVAFLNTALGFSLCFIGAKMLLALHGMRVSVTFNVYFIRGTVCAAIALS